MVEQLTFQTVFQFLQTVGILVGVFYYIMTIRANQRNQELSIKSQESTLETRQTNILMNLYTYQGSEEFQSAVQTLANAYVGMETPVDPDEFIERNGPPDEINDVWVSFFRVCWYWNGLGMMVDTGYASFDLVYRLWGHQVTWFWDHLKRVVQYEREFFNQPLYFEWFEYLNNRIVEHEGQDPERVG